MDLITCKECGEQHRDDLWICPSCSCATSFPNVNAAARQREQDELQLRYQEVLNAAHVSGSAAIIAEFEQAIRKSEAVICRYFGELARLAYSDEEVYATYYQRIAGGVRIPGGDKWARLRAVADAILFGPQNMIHIRFAALSLNGSGLENYGDCSLSLKDSVIAHRASVFEENSVMFMPHHSVNAGNEYEVPLGYRALWRSRHLLAVAKLAKHITAATSPKEFVALLLTSAADPALDDFLEVHVWGVLTIRSLSKVTVRNWVLKPSDLQLKEIEEKLAQFQVILYT
jgi:hypothetical protein